MLNTTMIDVLKAHAPELPAIRNQRHAISYGELVDKIESCIAWLKAENIQRVLLIDDNSIDWIVVDLACLTMGLCVVPLPTFFSEQQQQHVIEQVQPDLIIGKSFSSTIDSVPLPFGDFNAYKNEPAKQVMMPKGTQKVTFTSGTTGEPKGVCLSQENQLTVAQTLAQRFENIEGNHLSLLPLSLLLENVAGVYASLIKGNMVVLLSEIERGFTGCQLTSPNTLLNAISEAEPATLILVPELLQYLVLAIKGGWQAPESLRFVAVGGSKVPLSLLTLAKQLGIPAVQGYGLSECGSVVTLDDSAEVTGTIGKPLPHVSVRVANNTLRVTGNCFLGYLNQPKSWYPEEVDTEDLVAETPTGIAYLGRKKNVLVNSFGRNISPEWLETELMASGAFRFSMVVGDAQPFCVALVVPINPEFTYENAMQQMVMLNKHLPPYAQIQDVILMPETFLAASQFFTANGRPKRHDIEQYFSTELNNIYSRQHQSEPQYIGLTAMHH